jgi:hypothetical protein
VLGFDGSYRGGSTALVAATIEERPYLWIVGLWERPDRAPAEWVVDRVQVDATVKAAMERFDVCELACDPFGWHAVLARWADAYAQVVLEFPANQRSRMGVAVSRFTSAVLTGGLAHDGDPRLARHIGHVVARETAEGGAARERLEGVSAADRRGDRRRDRARAGRVRRLADRARDRGRTHAHRAPRPPRCDRLVADTARRRRPAR